LFPPSSGCNIIYLIISIQAQAEEKNGCKEYIRFNEKNCNVFCITPEIFRKKRYAHDEAIYCFPSDGQLLTLRGIASHGVAHLKGLYVIQRLKTGLSKPNLILNV